MKINWFDEFIAKQVYDYGHNPLRMCIFDIILIPFGLIYINFKFRKAMGDNK